MMIIRAENLEIGARAIEAAARKNNKILEVIVEKQNFGIYLQKINKIQI